jgi:hypothetical protein
MITTASLQDVSLNQLINSAYRGESSKKVGPLKPIYLKDSAQKKN